MYSEYVLNVRDVQILCQKSEYFWFQRLKNVIKDKYLNKFVLF